MRLTHTEAVIAVGVGLVGLFLAVALTLIFWPADDAAPAGAPVFATSAPAVQSVDMVAISPPTVQVYAPKAKARIKLPAAQQADAAVHVLTASQVRADERPHTLYSLLDERTGEVQTYDRADPQPWLAPETRGELGISYGLRGDANSGQPMGRLSLRQNLLQLKSVRLGAQASLDQDGQWFVGVGAFYRW